MTTSTIISFSRHISLIPFISKKVTILLFEYVGVGLGVPRPEFTIDIKGAETTALCPRLYFFNHFKSFVDKYNTLCWTLICNEILELYVLYGFSYSPCINDRIPYYTKLKLYASINVFFPR